MTGIELTLDFQEHLDRLLSTDSGKEIFILIIQISIAIQKIYLRRFPRLGPTLASLEKVISVQLENERVEFFNDLTKTLFFSNDIPWLDLVALGSDNNIPTFQSRSRNCSSTSFQGLMRLKYPCLGQFDHPCCNLFQNVTIDEHLETFLSIMKYSYLRNFNDEQDKEMFLDKFAKKLYQGEKPTLVSSSYSTLNTFLICDQVSDFQEAESSCQHVHPVVTGNGLCYSYNGLQMHELYKASSYSQMWNSTFGGRKTTVPVDPSRTLYIVVQSYKPSSLKVSQNFMLSFTSQFSPFDVVNNSFEIMAGFQHDFRIIPSVLSTSSRFDELPLTDRKCRLKIETHDMELLKSYSKSGCEFECAIKKSADTCRCLPWSIPRIANHSKTCDMLGNRCFKNSFNSPSTYENCSFLNDCQNVMYTFSESSRPIVEWLKLCSNTVIGRFQSFRADYSLDLTYKRYILNIGPPDPDSLDDICEYVVKNFVSVIRVEIGTKSVIKSVRDVKTTFETQLSAIGKELGNNWPVRLVRRRLVREWLIKRGKSQETGDV